MRLGPVMLLLAHNNKKSRYRAPYFLHRPTYITRRRLSVSLYVFLKAKTPDDLKIKKARFEQLAFSSSSP